MRNFLLLLFLSSFFYSPAQKVNKGPIPNWVNVLNIDGDQQQKDGAFNYLLIDFQDNIQTEEYYVHYATQVYNSEGIQDFSDISVSFDPTYQTLTIHNITIHRDGRKLDKLAGAEINTYQRETSLERSLYDGSVTAVVNLTDVRKNDIIEYSLTIKGFNPIKRGHYAARFYQQYTSPVERIYSRVLCPYKKKMAHEVLNGAEEPKIKENRDHIEYLWDLDGTDSFTYDGNVPYWMDFQKHVSMSTFGNWSAVNELFIPHYQFPLQRLVLPHDVLGGKDSKEDQILHLIRFVQDEIRYLGFESGIGAYKPNPPQKVLNQRYGDCKDKSLLLATLLQQHGIDAHPVLVNSSNLEEIEKYVPSHNLFDHCIVHFNFEGTSYVIDPTISNQGGNLRHMYTPDYKVGLLLKKGSNKLMALPKTGKRPEITITETITTDSIGGKAIFLIESVYRGSKADEMRDYFFSNPNDKITNDFLNFYSGLYPTIQSTDRVYFTDDSRYSSNEIKIEEYYNIEDFWNIDFNPDFFVAESQPMVLQSMIEYVNSPSRKMPYYLGEPVSFAQETNITLPEYWNTNDIGLDIDNEAFNYQRSSNTVGRTVQVKHEYERKKNLLQASDVAGFIKEQEKINKELNYQLTYPKNSAQNSGGLSWISYVISFLFLTLGILLGRMLYRRFNPQSKGDGYEEPIGGWMILPAIGLVLTPVILIYQVVTNGYFNSELWTAYQGYENAGLLTFAAGLELGYNVLLLVFTILLIILFSKKRTSVPVLMVVFYVINLVVPILDTLFINAILPEELLDPAEDRRLYADIAKKAVSAGIWIPYFLISTRVKNTFVRLYFGGEPVKA